MSANGAQTPSLEIALPAELVEQVAARAAEIVAERPPAAEPWLNVEQAAEHLAISASQMYTLCSRRGNGLPVTKEGSRSYFKASELDAWRRGEQPANVTDMRIERL